MNLACRPLQLWSRSAPLSLASSARFKRQQFSSQSNWTAGVSIRCNTLHHLHCKFYEWIVWYSATPVAGGTLQSISRCRVAQLAHCKVFLGGEWHNWHIAMLGGRVGGTSAATSPPSYFHSCKIPFQHFPFPKIISLSSGQSSHAARCCKECTRLSLK